MVDSGPGPLGLCPVRRIVGVEQDSNVWLANTGSQPIQIDKDEVVAMAECILAEPRASAGNDRDDGDELNGLVERASPHLTSEECRQLRTSMAARKHLFAKGKGDLGRTDIDISIRSTRATNPPSSKESYATRPRAGRRNTNWLRTCWPSASSKRATVRGAVQPS